MICQYTINIPKIFLGVHGFLSLTVTMWSMEKNLLFSVLVLPVIWLMIEALELRTVSLDQLAFTEELIIPVEVETDHERRQLLASQ